MTEGRQTICVSGELGAGKSAVTRVLSERLDARRISMGDVQRTEAARRGISILELNALAELEPEIDAEVDRRFLELAGSDGLVVDSRLAWHFLPNALKVHLLVDPEVGAQRVLSRGPSSIEEYGSLAEAAERIAERVAIERRRFENLYSIDILALRNYDLVIDTTSATIDEVVAAIMDAGPPSVGPLYVDPRRLYPTLDPISALRDVSVSADVLVGYSYPDFFIVRGHAAVSSAIRSGQPLIPAVLLAEGAERVVGNISANEYLVSQAQPDQGGQCYFERGESLSSHSRDQGSRGGPLATRFEGVRPSLPVGLSRGPELSRVSLRLFPSQAACHGLMRTESCTAGTGFTAARSAASHPRTAPVLRSGTSAGSGLAASRRLNSAGPRADARCDRPYSRRAAAFVEARSGARSVATSSEQIAEYLPGRGPVSEGRSGDSGEVVPPEDPLAPALDPAARGVLPPREVSRLCRAHSTSLLPWSPFGTLL